MGIEINGDNIGYEMRKTVRVNVRKNMGKNEREFVEPCDKKKKKRR